MSTPTIKIYNQQSEIDMMVKSFQGPTGPQGKGLTDAQIQAALDATDKANAAREGIADAIEVKADAITDTSARAASHELHAQDGRMNVTLFGKTTETGSGDKSPDNPYHISGVDVAKVQVCGKNLANIGTVTFTVSRRIFLETPLAPGNYTISALCTSNGTDRETCRAYFCDANNNELRMVDLARGSRASGTVTIAEPAHNILLTAETSLNLSSGDTATWTDVQIEAGTTATAYEPYNANVIDMPLLPDGAPLMGNGTVNDTVENDVLSGCNVKVTFSSSGGWKNRNTDAANVFSFTLDVPIDLAHRAVFRSNLMHRLFVSGIANAPRDQIGVYGTATTGTSNTIYLRPTGLTTLDELNAYLAANPLTVFYRSKDYTPEKDLRVCRVTRRLKKVACSEVSSEHSSIAGVFKMVVPSGYGSTTKNDSCNIFNVSTAAWTDIQDMHVRHLSHNDARFKWSAMAGNIDDVNAYLAENPLEITLPLTTEQVYMTDPLPLRKPDTLTTYTVTVTGSGETAVEYPHDTKHYIDSQIAAAVALALGN